MEEVEEDSATTLPFSKTISLLRMVLLSLVTSPLTVTCGGLPGSRATPMVMLAPGLMFQGTITRNVGLESQNR